MTPVLFFFFFNDTATTEIYTLSLHDALPISRMRWQTSTENLRGPTIGRGPRDSSRAMRTPGTVWRDTGSWTLRDRKSTRLNSSHSQISYAVFCLKKKKKTTVHIW